MKFKDFIAQFKDDNGYYDDFDMRVLVNVDDDNNGLEYNTYDLETVDVGYSSKIIVLGLAEEID